MSEDLYAKAVDFVKENRKMIEDVSEELLTRKTMTGDEISRLFTEYENTGEDKNKSSDQ